jgi:hypothetical protein
MSLFNIEDLKTPAGAMKSTWHTTIFVAVLLTLIAVVLAARAQPPQTLSGLRFLIDAALVLLLGFGVRKRSRVSAALLFGLWVLNTLYAVFCLHAAFGVLSVLVGVVYFAGLTGTLDYHRQLRDAQARANQA